jgi:hypothetical protein
MPAIRSSDFEGPVFDKVFLQATDKAFAYDLRGPAPRRGQHLRLRSGRSERLEPDAGRHAREDAIVNAFTTGKLDLTYAADSRSKLKTGVQYKLFRNDGYQRRNRVDYDGSPALPAGLKYVSDQRSLIPYVVGDVDAIFAILNQKRDLSPADDQPGSDYSLTEKTAAAYVQYQFDGQLAGRRLRADAGLRYYDTRLTSVGMVSNGTALAPAVISHRYDGVLPAVNLAWDLDENVALRLAANRDISRPSLSDLRAAASVDAAPFGGSIAAGNPNLRPFMANSLEASLEIYQGRAGALAVSVFHKTMESFITVETGMATYGSTGYPLQFLNPGQTGSTRLQRLAPGKRRRRLDPGRRAGPTTRLRLPARAVRQAGLHRQRHLRPRPRRRDHRRQAGAAGPAAAIALDLERHALLRGWPVGCPDLQRLSRRLSRRGRRERQHRLGLPRHQQHRRRGSFQRRARIEAGGRGVEPHRPGDRPVHRLGRRPPAVAHPQRPNRHPGCRL